MARPDTWMPFYWGDFWMDTGHLTPAEGWAYINLIGAYWVKGGPLEADEERLQRLAKVTSLSEWERVRKAVLAFFTVTVTDNGNCYSHSRIDRELTKAKKAYKSRVDHMNAVNEKRRKTQSPPTVTDTSTATVTVEEQQSLSSVTDTKPQPHSPKGDIRPSDGADAPLKERIFREGLDFLAKASGKIPNDLRSLVGKWCSVYGDELTLKAIIEAQRNSPLSPIPYCEKVLKNAKRESVQPEQTRLVKDDEYWRKTIGFWKKTSIWPQSAGPEYGYGGCEIPPHIVAEFNLDGMTPPGFLKRSA